MAEIKDSGNRREFDSGAVRDMAEGKGRCDLLPLSVVSFILDDPLLANIAMYIETKKREYLCDAIVMFIRYEFEDRYTAMLEVAIHYEDGCKKYGERNWEKGIPLHCFIDSALRHYFKYRRGDTDERHDRAFIWNLLGAIWTMDNHEELCDI